MSDRDRAEDALAVLHRAVDAVVDVLSGHDDWGPSGDRHGQYASDVVADAAAVAVLRDAGMQVLSEESGLSDGGGLIAVLDPLDGSTNAARGIPWFASSVCAVDSEGPLASVVHDLAGGTRFEATRGGGARRDGEPLEPRTAVRLEDAIIGVNDVPPGHGGWAQFRSLGASALDLCAVADGRLDGYVDFDPDGHGVWDYLGATLVCAEVGVDVVDGPGRDLVTLDHGERRAPVAGAGSLLAELLDMRSALIGRSRS